MGDRGRGVGSGRGGGRGRPGAPVNLLKRITPRVASEIPGRSTRQAPSPRLRPTDNMGVLRDLMGAERRDGMAFNYLSYMVVLNAIDRIFDLYTGGPRR